MYAAAFYFTTLFFSFFVPIFFAILTHLDCSAIGMHNERMDIPGRVENGVIVLEGGVRLPEGAQVVVSLRRRPNIRVAPTQRPVQLPIFDYDGPPDIDLTNDQIAEILTREDAPA